MKHNWDGLTMYSDKAKQTTVGLSMTSNKVLVLCSILEQDTKNVWNQPFLNGMVGSQVWSTKTAAEKTHFQTSINK